jgi:hypothetical protein
MPTESERKFLVQSEAWRGAVTQATAIRQFYLVAEADRSLRVYSSTQTPTSVRFAVAAKLGLELFPSTGDIRNLFVTEFLPAFVHVLLEGFPVVAGFIPVHVFILLFAGVDSLLHLPNPETCPTLIQSSHTGNRPPIPNFT